MLLQAYRGADGVLTVGTHKVLEGLKLTANADIFDYRAAHSRDSLSLVQLEERQIRALIGIAGTTNSELRDLVDAARGDFTGLLREIALDLNKEGAGFEPFSCPITRALLFREGARIARTLCYTVSVAMKNITVTLPEDVAAWLRVRAAKNGRSVSRWLAELLEGMQRGEQEYELAMERYLARKPRNLVWTDGRFPTREELNERSGLR